MSYDNQWKIEWDDGCRVRRGYEECAVLRGSGGTAQPLQACSQTRNQTLSNKQ